jgi:hypothetical protein
MADPDGDAAGFGIAIAWPFFSVFFALLRARIIYND